MSQDEQSAFPRAWRIRCAAAFLCLLLACRLAGMIPIFREVLLAYLGVDDAAFGMLFSIGSAAGLLAILPGGVIADRKGPVSVIRVGMVGVAIAYVVLACTGASYWGMAAGFALYQCMMRPLGLAGNALLIRLFPNRKRRIISLSNVVISGGDFMFPIVAEGLLFLTHRVPQITFAMVLHLPFALVAVVLLLGGALFRPQLSTAGTAIHEPFRLRTVLRFRGRTWALILLCGAHGAADMLIFFWWARFMGSAVFPEQPIPPGFFLSGFAVSYFLARAALAALPEHRWRRRLMVLPGLLGGAVLILGLLSRNYMLTGAAYIVGCFLWSSEMPTFLSRIAEQAEDRFGAALAAQQMTAAGLTAVGMWAMGRLINALPEADMWKAMLVPAAVFPAIGLGGALWLWWNRRVEIGTGGPGVVSI